MNSFFKVVAIFVFFLGAIEVFTQDLDSLHNQDRFFSIQAQEQDQLKHENDFTVIPIVFYTPETTFGFGVGGQGTFYTKGSSPLSRPSSLFFSGVYTARKQFFLVADPKIYFNDEKFLLEGSFKYKIFPDYFWGIGNETPADNREDYNMRSMMMEVAFMRRLKPYVNFGFEYELDIYNMLDYEETGLVASTPYFKERTVVSAFSMMLNFDSRDNDQSPSHGSFFTLETGVASRALGSSTSFNYASVDMRKYFPLSHKRKFILATQVFFNSTNGRVPFQKLSRYGGSMYARGYYLGRYTDYNMMVTQVELRWNLKGKWAVAGFGALGDVFDEFHDIRGKNLKSSVGGGVRWQIRKDSPSLLRLDIAYGFNVSDKGIYFGVNEAF